jgi:hypothetical protein
MFVTKRGTLRGVIAALAFAVPALGGATLDGDAAAQPAAAASPAQTLLYIGTRHRSFSGDLRDREAVPYDDRYDVSDTVTIERTGTLIDRTENLDFKPVGTPLEKAPPEVERREREESVVQVGQLTVLRVNSESTTSDHPTIFTNVHESNVAQEEMTSTSYDRPRVVAVLSGRPTIIVNGVARKIDVASALARMSTRVDADGSIKESGRGGAGIEHLSQLPNGSAHFYNEFAGFSSYDLLVEPPVSKGDGRSIHVVTTTTGRAIGDTPKLVKDTSVNDWYPGGVPGRETDVVHGNGEAALPYVCGHPLGLERGYETIENRARTFVTGRVESELIQTFTHGNTILCTIDDKDIRTFDPATGLLATRQYDNETLSLASPGSPDRSLALFAMHEEPFVYGADRHAMGAPALVIGTKKDGVVALRVLPASIDVPDVSLGVDPPLARAILGDRGKIVITAGDAPGRATLTARLQGEGAPSASLPILIYPTLSVGCEQDETTAIAFDQGGVAQPAADASKADVYASRVSGSIDCGGAGTFALYFPLGATVLHYEHDSAAFARLQPSSWKANDFGLDGTSDFGRSITKPASADDDSQDILLIKTHAGNIVKVLCSRRATLSLVGAYAVSHDGAFAY